MKTLLLALFGLLVLLGLTAFFALRHPVFGASPQASDRMRFAASAQYNTSEQAFENRLPERVASMRENSSLIRMLKEFLADRAHGSPAKPLPENQPDLARFLAQDKNAQAIWFGHSTFLLNIAGTVVLVDPVFSASAAPVNFIAPRFQPPVLSLENLPPVDVILISHDHYDHLDRATVAFFTKTSARFVAPLGVGSHLQRWGIDARRIIERDWWETTSVGKVDFTATPAQHFSGRNGLDTNATLWASWVIANGDTRLFFSGDSGYDTHFAEIGARLGPFDMAFLENGQYDEKWRAVHLLPEETAQAFEDLNAERLLPIHWGMFELAFHTWFDPIVAIASLADRHQIELVTPLIGEVFSLDASHDTERWWEDLLPGTGN